jgi:hypothetical protein
MLIGAFVVIVLLTWALVVLNIRSVVVQFAKDQNVIRLYSYLGVLLIMGSLITGVTSAVIQRSMDAELFLRLDASGPSHYYRR